MSITTIRRADLRGLDLQGVDLRGAVLSRADLREVDLGGADLRGAVLNRTDLRWADLSGANLSGATLSVAGLRGANLDGANLGAANLGGADLDEASLDRANLRWTNLRGADLSGARLERIRDDLYHVLSHSASEAPALLEAIRKGRINGSLYVGECCCLVGTLARARGCAHTEMPGIRPNPDRLTERWFLALAPGMKPGNNQIAAITAEWLKAWIDGDPC